MKNTLSLDLVGVLYLSELELAGYKQLVQVNPIFIILLLSFQKLLCACLNNPKTWVLADRLLYLSYRF